MFSLIVAIVAIALVTALVATTMHYGGDMSSKGGHEAEVARSLNELGQISAALMSHKANTGADATSIQELTPTYLSSVPTGWGVSVDELPNFEVSKLNVKGEEAKLAACNDVNKRLGHEGEAPACSDIPAGFAGCCVAS